MMTYRGGCVYQTWHNQEPNGGLPAASVCMPAQHRLSYRVTITTVRVRIRMSNQRVKQASPAYLVWFSSPAAIRYGLRSRKVLVDVF